MRIGKRGTVSKELATAIRRWISSVTWNEIDLPQTVTFSTGSTINYYYAADGSKLREVRAVVAGGSTTTTTIIDWCGDLVLEKVGSAARAAKRLRLDGGYVDLASGNSARRYFVRDHLGSVRAVVNDAGTVLETDDYYPLGGPLPTGSNTALQPEKYQGKDWNPAASFNVYDFGARLYDPALGRWLSQDPMAEKYYLHSPYLFCAGNPMIIIDPNGQRIRGVSKQDIIWFQNDIFEVLADDKFMNIRSLINIKGNAFQRVDEGEFLSVMKGNSFNDDEIAYINMLVGTINSKNNHTIEYVSGDFVSSKGSIAFIEYMDKLFGDGMGDKATVNGRLRSSWVYSMGNGYNVPTQRGSHSFVSGDLQGKERAVTSGHEVFGHGIPATNNLTPAENNANAIRADNLIRRLLGLPQRDGSDHGGYKEGHIINPYDLPIIK